MLNSVLAISAGAALGALLRWLLSASLNAVFPALPPGTLVANLIGGYLIGVAAAVFVLHPGIGTEWRQFIVTGLLGGLTTFSTFSLEVTGLLQLQRFGWAATAIAAHVAGSLIMTALGFASVSLLRRAG
jgi:fluoride exporter